MKKLVAIGGRKGPFVIFMNIKVIYRIITLRENVGSKIWGPRSTSIS